MICKTCKSKMPVIESRIKPIGTYRRYKCFTCNSKPVPTMERIVYKEGKYAATK